MRAAVMWEAGGQFEVRSDAECQSPGPGQVAVRIRAAGVCQTDISLAHGAFGQSMPVILGHEGAGEIVEVGVGVTGLAAGDRVLITWVPPCGYCYHCVRHEPYICSNRKRSGDESRTSGLSVAGIPVQAGLGTATFAEETIVPAPGVLPLPGDIPFELAALLGCAIPTGFGAAVNSAEVEPGDSVLVIGCGAVGLSALQGARIAGAAELVAVDPFESRRSLAVSLGATHAVEPGVDPSGALIDAPGFDVVIDAVARSSTIGAAWRAARRGGRIVIVGAGRPEDLVEFSAQELFHDEKKLIGSYYGSSDMKRELPRLVSLWRAGRLDLTAMVDDVVDLDKINDVVARQRAGTTLRTMLTL
ncbi:Zn-dependent alcohol dehydrogenase [Gordonia rhizosphera]|uniref:Putative zinc-containing alcohol dehydrogenase n=1 Tax=Gordonia rhizosphera NBRC 16068 TaxID=1108045 RepID=K6X4I4_9ACTN|nr:Zn-dependent alcohol dehydrogenase [Gordonia rhizosphera]GAB93709.1 putative zinc-containing alcohol dehydrogenase [Gordonia rhizosphera NBRC 16068]